MPESMPLTPGMRVRCRDAEWLVTKVESADYKHKFQAVHCVGVDDLVRGHQSIFLEQLDELILVDPTNTKLVPDSSNGYKRAKLFLEAQLRQIPVTGLEPNFEGMGAFEPFEFQKETVRRALLQLRPRLLIADAVGLGKTIQVGMILTELLRRGRADRILVLAKKSMLLQFQSEIWNRFNIPLVRLDSVGIAKLRLQIPANKNPFEVYHRVIISLDTLKNIGRYRHFLEDTRWDVVVIDEAHNVAGASDPNRHLSYRLARLLSRRTDCMLLTTATPHNGKPETFGRLISLLDPSVIPDPKFREYEADDIKHFFLMRFKEDVRLDVGNMLPERKVIPLQETMAEATPAEEQVYEALGDLRRHILKSKNSSGNTKQQGNTLVQYGFYKQFLSSPESCLSAVEKHLTKRKEAEIDHDDGREVETYLETLRDRLRKLELKQTARYRLLKKQLEAIGWNGSASSPRVLVFTEYRKTQQALVDALAEDFGISYSQKFEDQPKQPIAVIHGSCPDIHLMATVESFGTGSSPIRMLLATDVASEGINLHHECHNIIHFDLPWSIITLIQRNGRIDRLGQKNNPILRYLLVETKQGLLDGDKAIFERLVEKVEEINRLRQTGESILKLYDPELEEKYIAEKGIMVGNQKVLDSPAVQESNETSELEKMLLEANEEGREELLKYLLADSSESPDVTGHANENVRLYSDRDFLVEGYQYLLEQDSNYAPIQEDGGLIRFVAPQDLKRRLGAPSDRGDVIFGSTAIPNEAWPENDEFRLSDKVERIELAIQAARNTSGYWSNELLCSNQHPILQWISERLVMQVPREETPLVVSNGLDDGELCFCFVGQLSSKAGTPLIVNAHAISFKKGGGFQHRSLREALEQAHFDRLVNTGEMPNWEVAKDLIVAAVNSSIEYMHELQEKRSKKIRPLLDEEENRLNVWRNKRRNIIQMNLPGIEIEDSLSESERKELQWMDDFLKDRKENWLNAHFRDATNPTTRLILVIAGKK